MKAIFKNIARQGLNYLPGFVILMFGMIALQSSVLLINEYEQLTNGAALSSQITSPHNRLYWSVIALGLCGFVLLLLNAQKMKKLSDAAEEKRSTLKKLESRSQAIEASRDGIVIIDPAGNLIYMNSALMDMHGIAPEDEEQFLNQSWMTLYNKEEQEKIAETVLKDLHKNNFWRGEAPAHRHDGQDVQAELSFTLLDDGSMIGTARDTTKRKKAEREKADLQKQFFQAQKMEAIGRLAGGIAHDFNNILAAMNGYAEFLSDDLEEGTSQHKFAENILKAGQQAKKLVDEILTFSRIKDHHFEAMDLSEVLREILMIFDVTLPKTVSIKTDIPEAPYTILGNGDHVSQMVMNMCVNALDAIQENEDEKGNITVSMKIVDQSFYKELGLEERCRKNTADIEYVTDLNEKPDGSIRLVLGTINKDVDYIACCVQDTGIGMTRETLEHVFDPFFTTKAVDKGTGLGMSMAHGVVQSHKAVMVIDTKSGEGTSFYILFPQAQAAAEQLDHAEDPQAGSALHVLGHVLLVEDQEEVAQMTEVMLERIGFEVTYCNSGAAALEELCEGMVTYDLVLTDQNMPKMTGLELVAKAEQEGFETPFVLLSGYSEKKLLESMKKNKLIYAVLRKPIKQNDLAIALQDVLTQKKNKVAA